LIKLLTFGENKNILNKNWLHFDRVKEFNYIFLLPKGLLCDGSAIKNSIEKDTVRSNIVDQFVISENSIFCESE